MKLEDELRVRRFDLGEVQSGERRIQEAKHLRTGEQGFNHTREADEGDAEEHEYFHFHQTRGRGSYHHTRQV